MGIRFGFVSIARTLHNNQSSRYIRRKMDYKEWPTETVVIKLSATAHVRLLIQSSAAEVYNNFMIHIGK